MNDLNNRDDTSTFKAFLKVANNVKRGKLSVGNSEEKFIRDKERIIPCGK
jgi:hypothetical protein